ncbi:12672_t:CDS:2, partial [Racocetra persica]
HFMAGIQSTQKVESKNTLIQKAVQSSFSLLEVQEVLENHLEFEPINNIKASILNDDLFEPFYDKQINENSKILAEADESKEFDLQSLIQIVNPNNFLKI